MMTYVTGFMSCGVQPQGVTVTFASAVAPVESSTVSVTVVLAMTTLGSTVKELPAMGLFGTGGGIMALLLE